MRFTCKLAVLVAIGVGAQLLINRHADDIDEAQFTIRVFVASLCGGVATDPGVMDMAVALRDRQADRNNQRVNAIRVAAGFCAGAAGAAPTSDRNATTRPADVRRDAFIVEELESSLASMSRARPSLSSVD